MLFAVSWTPISSSEETVKRALQMFGQWEPPEGVEFQGFWDYANGSGGLALVETNSAERLMETTAPWAPFLAFDIKPLVPAEEGAAISAKAAAWRDSLS